MAIKEQIQEKMANLNDKQIYWLLAGILLVFFLIDFFVLMRPQLNTLNKINPMIKRLETDIGGVERNMSQMEHFRGEVARLENDISGLNEKVLHRQEVPLILEKISRIATKNKIKIDQVMPDSVNQDLILENDAKRYYTLPIFVEAQGGYHDFGTFINLIENESIIITVRNFKIAAREGTKKHTIELNLNAIVYEESSKWGN